MKIGITGHTSGLGKAIYNHFVSQGHEVIGMSRSTGHTIPEAREDIVKIAESCDVFFNNAHVGLSQSEFIKKLFRKTKIITSGSMGADYWETGETYYIEKYNIEKTHKVCKEFTKLPMLLLKMGYLENYTDRESIPYSQIINSIEFWFKNPRISMIEFNNIR
jgi:nucleoside-diphosphate-sugar epimerase